MAKSNATTLVEQTEESTRLTPTVVDDETQAADVAFDGKRKRPVLAINDDGKLVVCCRATARVKGWEVQGALHARPTEQPTNTPKRRASDKEGHVILPPAKARQVKAALSDAAAHLGLEDLLGK